MDQASFASAYALSMSAGLRPFLTLALASLAMHFGYLHPAHAFAFLGADGTTALLAALAALEFVADKVPVVDHGLHVLHFAVKPIAAAILVGSVVPHAGFDGAIADAAMLFGAMNALGVHAGVTTVRGASTAMTLGIANPFVSACEDALAAAATIVAVLAPFVAVIVAGLITYALVAVVRSIIANVRACGPNANAGRLPAVV